MSEGSCDTPEKHSNQTSNKRDLRVSNRLKEVYIIKFFLNANVKIGLNNFYRNIAVPI